MKNILAGFLCVGLCIAVAVFLPQTGTSNPMVDETGCLAAGCHDAGFGEGSLHAGSHSDLGCESCHETETGGGPVATASCLACHPVGGEPCDMVLAHPEAGCLAVGCHADCEVAEGCVVTIDCDATELCPDDECTTCTATTECDGEPADGEYTWSLDMEATTGDSIEICPEDLTDGENNLMVTDNANDAEATETIEFNGAACQEPTDCRIDVLRDSLPKSNWFALPLFFRIETFGIDPLTFLTPVNIVCEADGQGTLGLDSVLKTGKIIQPSFGTNTTVIWQTAIVWPTWITQSGGVDSETCIVTVGDCTATDTFELDHLPFFLSK